MSQKRFQVFLTLFTTFVLALGMTGSARADEGVAGSVAYANGYTIKLVFTEPVKVGQNQFHVQISDAMGMPVTLAEVEVTAMTPDNMSKHAHAPAAEAAPAADSMAGMSGMDMGGMTAPSEADTHSEAEAGSVAVALHPGSEKGEYAGEISLNEASAWTFSVHFTRGAEMTEVEFPVEVVSSLPRTGILAGFFGLNAAVIAVAAFLKRKPVLA
jgi:hypothetical protein